MKRYIPLILALIALTLSIVACLTTSSSKTEETVSASQSAVRPVKAETEKEVDLEPVSNTRTFIIQRVSYFEVEAKDEEEAIDKAKSSEPYSDGWSVQR